ncbi:MAG: hypothetical protein R3B99_32970 [Polyangiales bacterium]
MNKLQKIAYLDELIERTRSLLGNRGRTGAPDFVRWSGDINSFLGRFAPSRESDFDKLRFTLGFATTRTPDSSFQNAFDEGLARAVGFLESVKNDIVLFEAEPSTAPSPPTADRVVRVCRRFPAVARQLMPGRRHAGRPGIDQCDEYDVQDVLHALLLLDFDDVREEEWTPSYASKSARMDFLLKVDRLVIEVKRTRKGLGAKEAKEELAIDIDHYRVHPDCGTLVCFVYDPDHLIRNPAGFERDLEGQRTDQLDVRVVVAPRD